MAPSTRTRTHHTSSAGLRSRKLLARDVEPERLNAVLPPSQEAARRALEALLCPWCGKGPWENVAGHTVRAHGVDRKELRDIAGYAYNVSLTSDRLRQRNADRARERGAPDGSLGKGKPRSLSTAGKQIARAKLEACRSADQRSQASAAGRSPVSQAKRVESLLVHHAALRGPVEHGSRRMYRGSGCRCAECRAWNTAQHRAYLLRREAIK